MKSKKRAVLLFFLISALLLSGAFYLRRAYGKYRTEISVGTFDLTIEPAAASNASEFQGKEDGGNAVVEEKSAESDEIKFLREEKGG